MRTAIVVRLSPRRWAVGMLTETLSGIPVYDTGASTTYDNSLDALTQARQVNRARASTAEVQPAPEAAG